MDQGFGGHTYSLKSLFKDEQRKVVNEIVKPAVDRAVSEDRVLYEGEALLLRFMGGCYIPIPRELKATAEFALNSLLRERLQSDQLDLERIQSLFEDARVLQAPVDQPTLEILLRRKLEGKAETFLANPRDVAALAELRELVAAVKSLPLPLVLWSVQNRCYELLLNLYPEMKQNNESEWVSEFGRLAELLGFAPQMIEGPIAPAE
jgi:hypothetical protein